MFIYIYTCISHLEGLNFLPRRRNVRLQFSRFRQLRSNPRLRGDYLFRAKLRVKG